MGKAARYNKKRKHMLRDIEFSGYDLTAKDEFGFPPISSRAWLLLYQAIASAPSGPVEQTARGVSIFKKLRSSSEPGTGGEGFRRLKSAGAIIRLTNEELEYSKRMLERIREQIPVSQGDGLMLLDELLAHAKEVDETKLVAAPEGPRLEK